MSNPSLQYSSTESLLDDFFRHEAGKMVSVLTRVFGLDNMGLAEDVVQDAMLKALQIWSYDRIPDNPSAWIMRVARNRALDFLRRDNRLRRRQVDFDSEEVERLSACLQNDDLFTEREIRDDQLKMIFACCHPALPLESGIALTLKNLCGFSVHEIARAFLSTDQAVIKRLSRARQRLVETRTTLEVPIGIQAERRLDSVLRVIYLVFNEGYNASTGEELIRAELCAEAVRLARLLAEHEVSNAPKTHALLALLLFHSARIAGRISKDGDILLLKYQDRSAWDKQLINSAMAHLAESARGTELSQYHLEAGIAACHCFAESFETTDWPQILSYYDILLSLNNSPIIRLNRAVAVGQVSGPAAGLECVAGLDGNKEMQGYYLFHAIRGELYQELGELDRAAENFERALRLTTVPAECELLKRKILKCVSDQEHSLSRAGFMG
jgi:RNA polymerase sigma factor (sigma-70 family)